MLNTATRTRSARALPFSASRRVDLWDFVLPAAAVGSLLAYCLISLGRKPFWLDEITAWMLVSDRSFGHMMNALAHACDGGFPLYYVIGWGWGRLFGTSELSLRLFSDVALCIAVPMLWWTLRRAFSLRATALGVLTVCCASQSVLDNAAGFGRFYGLFFLTAALALAVWARVAFYGSSRLRLALSFLAHAALILTHEFGLLYSGLLVLAALIADVLKGRFRWRWYASMILAWAAVLIWLKPLHAIAGLADPWGWIVLPSRHDLLVIYSFGVWLLPVLLCGLAVLAALSRMRPGDTEEHDGGQETLLLAGLCLLAGPLVLFVISYLSIPILFESYVLPSAIGLAVVLAYLADLCCRATAFAITPPRNAAMVLERSLWAVVLAVLLFYPVGDALRMQHQQSLNDVVERLVPPGTPVVVEGMENFFELQYHNKRADYRYWFMLDRETALRGPHGAIVEYNNMRNWREYGYWADHLAGTGEFLCANPSFAVVRDPQENWWKVRIQKNPAFETREIAAPVLLVSQRAGAVLPGCQ